MKKINDLYTVVLFEFLVFTSLIILIAKSETDKGLKDLKRPILLNIFKNLKDIFSPSLIKSGCLIKEGG